MQNYAIKTHCHKHESVVAQVQPLGSGTRVPAQVWWYWLHIFSKKGDLRGWDTHHRQWPHSANGTIVWRSSEPLPAIFYCAMYTMSLKWRPEVRLAIYITPWALLIHSSVAYCYSTLFLKQLASWRKMHWISSEQTLDWCVAVQFLSFCRLFR